MSTSAAVTVTQWATKTLGDSEFYDRLALATWSREGTEVSTLAETAGRALLKEDRLLQSSFGSSHLYDGVGRGLSYWLFEHNLVYPIFREWAQTHSVLWDERDADWDKSNHRWGRRNLSAEERRKRHHQESRKFPPRRVARFTV